MTGTVSIRIISFLLAFLWSAVSIAVCQQPKARTAADSLPDAPSMQNSELPASSQGHSTQVRSTQVHLTQAPTLQSFQNTVGLPVTALPPTEWEPSPHFNFGHFESSRPVANPVTENEGSGDPFTRYLSARPLPGTASHLSASDSFFGRIGYAASSIFVTHDAEGASKLNTRYLLAVLTSAAAHSARTPYWRRSVSQPFSDFGATIGNDAGVNVLHAFEPGIRQTLKSHEPKFVTRIEDHSNPSNARD
jgi:hypothetical protein